MGRKKYEHDTFERCVFFGWRKTFGQWSVLQNHLSESNKQGWIGVHIPCRCRQYQGTSTRDRC
jgi:hypothetical protein